MTGISIAQAGDNRLQLLLALANRHGLIAGATGTGKTVSLQTLAEGFSQAGVPVFMADIKVIYPAWHKLELPATS